MRCHILGAIDVAQIDHRNPQNSYAVFLQPSIAMFVASRSITHGVAYSIYLDSKVRFRTIEIENVRADGVLTAKDRLTGASGA